VHIFEEHLRFISSRSDTHFGDVFSSEHDISADGYAANVLASRVPVSRNLGRLSLRRWHIVADLSCNELL